MPTSFYYPTLNNGDPYGAPGFDSGNGYVSGQYNEASSTYLLTGHKALTSYNGTKPAVARRYYAWLPHDSGYPTGNTGAVPTGATVTAVDLIYTVDKSITTVDMRVHGESDYNWGGGSYVHPSDTYQTWSQNETTRTFTFPMDLSTAPTIISGDPAGFKAVIRIFNMTTTTSVHVDAYSLFARITWTAAVPTVSTLTPVSTDNGVAAGGGGVISSNGGATVTAYGICWGASADPTTADSKAEVVGEKSGEFLRVMGGLTPGTTYHARGYATNSAGTGYGEDVTFTTRTVPTLTTTAITSITDTTASGGGNVSANGGSAITRVGLCWSTSPNPTTGSAWVLTSSLGAFTIPLAGLTPNTPYYVRAYAVNAAGTGYGSQVSFTTTNIGITLAVVTTTPPTNITGTGCDSGGNVTNQGGSAVTARGVCWSTTADPTTSDSKTTDGSGTGAFTSAVTGLLPHTDYYLRAYATNTGGTAYGPSVQLSTTAVAPTVTGEAALWNIVNVQAEYGGSYSDDGGAAVTEVGVVVSINPNPTILDTKYVATLGTSWTVVCSGLIATSTYHARAYATNADGYTGYGSDELFVTTSTPTAMPTVWTLPVSRLTTSSAVVGGRVVGDGRLTVTARGVCYGITATPDLTDTVVVCGSGLGVFSTELTDLVPGTHYHLRAYATNSDGTRYGGEVIFVTSDEEPPEAAIDDVLCPDRYDLMLTTEEGESHGLICDWSRGGAGLKIETSSDLTNSTAVSTKGDYGVRDATDHFRVIQTDWSEGCGQTTYDRKVDSENKFLTSNNVDVSKVGTFKLGPAILTSADSYTLPCALAALQDTAGNSYVFCASSTSPYLRYSTDNITWNDITPQSTGSGPAAAVTAMCSDGQYVYAVSGGEVFRGTTSGWETFSADSSNINITHIAFSSGVLYAVKDTSTTTAQLGSFSASATPAWTALTPAAGRNINAVGETIGLAASGNYVYWGITNGLQTKVYKALIGGGTVADVFQTVVTFPTGFIGASMCAYMMTVYVGGHFDGSAPTTGIGAIYAIVNDTPAILTDVGSDRSADNRVLSIAVYERSLYFVSGSQVWRWDLVRGGYSHYAGPLHDAPLIYYGGIVWEGQWSFAAEPGDTAGDPMVETLDTGGITAHGTTSVTFPDAESEHYGETKFVLSTDGAWREYIALANADLGCTDTIDDTVGTTLELQFPKNKVAKKHLYGELRFGINGSAKGAYVRITNKPLNHEVFLYTGNKKTTDDTLLAKGHFPYGKHTLRLTLKDAVVVLYVDGVEVLRGTATDTPTKLKTVWIRACGRAKSHPYYYYVGAMRWTTDGAYATDVGNQTAVEGVSLACARDAAWVACSGYGVARTDPDSYYIPSPDGAPATLTSSRTSGNMPTVDKNFASVRVELAKPLASGTSLVVSGAVDGRGFLAEEDSVRSSDSSKVYEVNLIGRVMNYAVQVATEDALLTPEVAEVAVLFDPMAKTPRTYTYYIRCWEGVESRTIGKEWDEDPGTVADFLENIVNTTVVVERPGREAIVGKIQTLEFLEAPPSGKTSGREGLYSLSIRALM